MSGQTLKIGTRKSAMALAQTEAIARLLRAADSALEVEIVKFETRGDQDQTSKLLRHGGKGGAFVAEIREAMRAGELQAAMHSLKDVPGNEETPGLIIAATLPRDAANDALVLRPGLSLDAFRASFGKGFRISHHAIVGLVECVSHHANFHASTSSLLQAAPGTTSVCGGWGPRKRRCYP